MKILSVLERSLEHDLDINFSFICVLQEVRLHLEI